jgi:hypothetical protein
MNKKRAGGGQSRRPFHRPGSRPGGSRPAPARRTAQTGTPPFQIVESRPPVASDWPEIMPAPARHVSDPGPFRVLIAVHRPRFRGRAERAAALVGWDVTALLNKQDPVGQCARAPRPPDLLVLSGDFGRQKDYAIFRAVQEWRKEGMRLIGLVDDCAAPQKLCDVCLEPPYTTAALRALFARLYTEIRHKPAPPPRSAGDVGEEE